MYTYVPAILWTLIYEGQLCCPLGWQTIDRIPLFKGGESVIRLSLGRRLVNPLPVAQRTNALHKWRRRQTWVVGREFESHVHYENAF